ncbi:hypothetical protein [Auraticoccus monumenti]|uniref:Uncharacterized protein n=1 Tax=Auraticoccus monumenti TaxID=675864 RepID=A0A1G7CXU5_9ACTN|nr:hypothetical protein [Auraticoccus monumenti]SDE43486.1 hypothetical protein SAMN04489747_3396 [Auraticoccus monumenti]
MSTPVPAPPPRPGPRPGPSGSAAPPGHPVPGAPPAPEAAASESDSGATEIEAALAGLDALEDLPVGEHHARLEHAHEVLHGVLQRARARD